MIQDFEKDSGPILLVSFALSGSDCSHRTTVPSPHSPCSHILLTLQGSIRDKSDTW